MLNNFNFFVTQFHEKITYTCNILIFLKNENFNSDNQVP